MLIVLPNDVSCRWQRFKPREGNTKSIRNTPLVMKTCKGSKGGISFLNGTFKQRDLAPFQWVTEIQI